MKFRILGTLEVRAYGDRVSLASPRQQRALAALLLSPNSVVPVERMVDALWEDEPPTTAVKQVRNCVSALRGRLGETGGTIVTDGPGYRLEIGSSQASGFALASSSGMSACNPSFASATKPRVAG